MRIGHYMSGLTAPGGIGSYLRRVTQAQRGRGYEVILFDRAGSASPDPEAPEAIFTRDDADLLRQAQARRLDVLHVHTIFDPGGGAAPAVVRTLHGHHAYCPSGSRFLARWSAPCPRRYTLSGCAWGHVVDRCGSVRPCQLLEGFQRVRQERRVLASQQTITISQFSKTQMLRSGYDPARISVVLNPAPAPLPEAAIAPAPAGKHPKFLFLGRLVAYKGMEWLVRAAARAPAGIDFEIIGGGPERERLLALARRLGVAGRFTWSDWLADERAVFARLAGARAVVFPSLWQEPAGLVPLEAAAAGRAVIASTVGGISEYARELGHALLVAPGDTAALAAALARLADDAGEAARLGREGWRRLGEGKLGLNEHLDSLEEVYNLARSHEPFAV